MKPSGLHGPDIKKTTPLFDLATISVASSRNFTVELARIFKYKLSKPNGKTYSKLIPFTLLVAIGWIAKATKALRHGSKWCVYPALQFLEGQARMFNIMQALHAFLPQVYIGLSHIRQNRLPSAQKYEATTV